MLDLASIALKSTYKKDKSRFMTKRPMHEIRAALRSARRFVLDESMSAFLANLATVPFLANVVRRHELLNTLRHSAILPFDKMFIQIDNIAFRTALIAAHEGGGEGAHDPWGERLLEARTTGVNAILSTYGWLLERMPGHPGVYTSTIFVEHENNNGASMLPFALAWRADDGLFDRELEIDLAAGALSHGLNGEPLQQIGILYSEGKNAIPDAFRIPLTFPGMPKFDTFTNMIVGEFAGDARYIFALLATINETPVMSKPVEASQKRFYAGGQFHRYLDHRVLTLRLPKNTTIARFATRLIASARRKAHQVRGHFRLYQKHEGATCELAGVPHEFGPVDENNHAACAHCTAWRTWIEPFERGDASLGYVVHDYNLTHGGVTSS